ncbi:MAG TPA: class I SAM-dependent methyltransferase [Polyangiaceae bacterium]|nr:class I SAM-dependent methyltransferase [Polyangiaceae bacterium]
MSESPTAKDWIGSRGEKWSAQAESMEAMLTPIDRPLIEALRLEQPTRVAEVGCGAGGTAMELRRRAPAGTSIHGFDISPKLIELARRRITAGSLQGSTENTLAFELADVSTHIPNQRYDRLVSRFGIMFFDDPAGAFSNLLRWLEPGGRIAFAVWGPLAENDWFRSVRDVVALFAEMPEPPPDAPGAFRYADVSSLLSSLQHAGFSRLEAQAWRGTLSIGGGLQPAQAATFVLSAFSSFADRLAAVGGGAFDRAHSALTTHFTERQRAGATGESAFVHIVTGERP